MHMLAWVRDLSAIRADLNASIPLDHPKDAFVVADTQKSDKSLLPVNHHPNSFVRPPWSSITLRRCSVQNIHAYITMLLGALRCRTDVQVANGKAMLLKYVSSYVTKMHDAANNEGLYS